MGTPLAEHENHADYSASAPTQGQSLDGAPGAVSASGAVSGSGAVSASGALVGTEDAAQEHAAEVARMARVWWFGALVWGSSVVLDWLAVTYVEPSPLGWFVELRAAELVVLGVRARATRHEQEAVRLEPMSPFERKVVHDAVAAAGLTSESEGVEPNRYVVVLPKA